jgi:hypothetical protein
MKQEICKIVWYCTACGGSGTAEMWADLSDWGKNAELVRSHSLKSPGCWGDARKTLRIRQLSDS